MKLSQKKVLIKELQERWALKLKYQEENNKYYNIKNDDIKNIICVVLFKKNRMWCSHSGRMRFNVTTEEESAIGAVWLSLIENKCVELGSYGVIITNKILDYKGV